MKKIIWQLRLSSLPTVERHCKKCGKKSLFLCSGQFRINAQKKRLDIWLIYKCSRCDDSWNATILSRISPASLPQEMLTAFFHNDPKLVSRYATDIPLMQKNGAQLLIPDILIDGDTFPLTQQAELEIKTEVFLPVKVSSLVRKKLALSQKAFSELTASGRIMGIPPQDLNRCRIKNGIRLIFNPPVSQKPPLTKS